MQSFLLLSISKGLQGSYAEYAALIFFGLVLPNQLNQPADEMKVGLADRKRGTGSYFLIYFRICNILDPNYDIYKWVKSPSSKREKEQKNTARLNFCSNFQNS